MYCPVFSINLNIKKNEARFIGFHKLSHKYTKIGRRVYVKRKKKKKKNKKSILNDCSHDKAWNGYMGGKKIIWQFFLYVLQWRDIRQLLLKKIQYFPPPPPPWIQVKTWGCLSLVLVSLKTLTFSAKISLESLRWDMRGISMIQLFPSLEDQC